MQKQLSDLLKTMEDEPTTPEVMLDNMVTLEEWIHQAFTRVERTRQQLEPAPEPTAQVAESPRVSTNGSTVPSGDTFPL